MRIVAFKKNSNAAIGVRDNNQVVDLSIAAPELPQTLRGLLVTDALGAARVALVKQSCAQSGRSAIDQAFPRRSQACAESLGFAEMVLAVRRMLPMVLCSSAGISFSQAAWAFSSRSNAQWRKLS